MSGLEISAAMKSTSLPIPRNGRVDLARDRRYFGVWRQDGRFGERNRSQYGENNLQAMQQTLQDEVFQSDNVLNEVDMELIWLGEESVYCLVCPEFQFDFIYEYASPALKVELRKLSRDDQSETEKLKQIVRMEDWRVSRHFVFTRMDIRINCF
jgi:hypothetical protein